MSRVLTFSAAGSDSTQISFIPQAIVCDAWANISALTVNIVEEGTSVELTGLELEQVANFGALTWEKVGLLLADGRINGKSVFISATATGAANISVISERMSPNRNIFKYSKGKALANTTTPVTNFFALGLENIGSNDTINITRKSGFNESGIGNDELDFISQKFRDHGSNYPKCLFNVDSKDPIVEVEIVAPAADFVYVVGTIAPLRS